MSPDDVARMQGVAKVLASAARLNARVAGMNAENAGRADRGATPAYDEKPFLDAIVEEGCDWNAVSDALRAGL